MASYSGSDYYVYLASIALDKNGFAHVCYYLGEDDALMYIQQTSLTTWSAPIALDSSGAAGDYVSMALDSNGLAHVSYFDWGSYSLKYIEQKSADNWGSIQTLDVDGEYVYTSIALDSNGLAHVSYYDSLNCALKYVAQTSSAFGVLLERLIMAMTAPTTLASTHPSL